MAAKVQSTLGFTRPVTVAIVGTAGRKSDGSRMNASLFRRMCATALDIIRTEWKLTPPDVRLVSGGAAWSDHVAVQLYLEGVADALCPVPTPVPVAASAAAASGDPKINIDSHAPFAGLTVHLPCAFETKSKLPSAVDTGSVDWRSNPGRLMNLYHQQFTAKMGRSTMAELVTAQHLGAILDTSHHGFHKRNKSVASSDYMIAFSWGHEELKDGGTKFTWDLCSSRFKRHVSLHSLASEKRYVIFRAAPSTLNANSPCPVMFRPVDGDGETPTRKKQRVEPDSSQPSAAVPAQSTANSK